MKMKMDTNPLFAGKTVAMHNFVERFNDSVLKEDAAQIELPYEKYVLYFGRFSWEKGVRTLVETAKQLPEVNFVFAGNGEYAEKIEKLSNAKNVGFKSGVELDALICNALFTIYPSEWYENCPFSVMESQERHIPVLGARIGGIPELIEDGKTGWLFESGNAIDLKDKILKIWESVGNKENKLENEDVFSFQERKNTEDYAKRLISFYE